MPRSLQEIQKDIDHERAEAKRLGNEAGDLVSKMEAGDNSDGLKERVRRVTVAMGRTDQKVDELDAEYKSALKDGLASGRFGSESGDGAGPVDNSRPSGGGMKGRLTLTKGQKVGDWLKANGHVDRSGQELSFDRYLKGMVTGDWKGADAERKAMSEGTATAGGHLVPTPLAASVIDLARNEMRVAQAGATIVPMTAQTLKVPRLTGEGTPAWRNENSPITAADMSFDSVTFTARSLNRLVTLSVELFEDSDPSAEGIIANSFAQQIALEMDRAALRGSGTAPEPRGVLNQSGITTTGHGANGDTMANLSYNFLIDSVGAVLGNNFTPTATIEAPRTEVSLGKLKDTTNQYIRPPAMLENIPRLTTKQIPTNLTVGTSTDCSEVYTGQWNMLGIGIRTGFRIQFLGERFADNGQVAFLAWLRADVQLFQPGAFVVDTGVRG